MWDPDQYNKYFKERHRPTLELISRIPQSHFDSIIDLGCGDGVVTKVLRDQFHPKEIVGLDNSTSMLAKAKDNASDIDWQLGDIKDFGGRYDLVFSNAALQWVDDHPALLSRLVACSKSTFAIQMPNNFDAPSHALLRETIYENPFFKEKLSSTVRVDPVMEKQKYFEILSPQLSSLDMWETEYLQPLTGEQAVLEWVKGTALVPIREKLTPEEYRDFESSYGEKLAQVYKPMESGITLFPFRRMFIVGWK